MLPPLSHAGHGNYALAQLGDLRGPYRPGDFPENGEFIAIRRRQRFDDFACVVCAFIHHCQKDAGNGEFWVDLPLYTGDGFEKQFQSLCGQVFGLHGDENGVRRCKRIDGEHPQ
ncbi:hypothetical protein SDC9_122733 [bioreactor metagenome]|uniref:Uncharacterized protein n=1 Tax=bioreactor metagenome TaxID=1076179 RepID=A0A645CFH8_9ZZZZ